MRSDHLEFLHAHGLTRLPTLVCTSPDHERDTPTPDVAALDRVLTNSCELWPEGDAFAAVRFMSLDQARGGRDMEAAFLLVRAIELGQISSEDGTQIMAEVYPRTEEEFGNARPDIETSYRRWLRDFEPVREARKRVEAATAALAARLSKAPSLREVGRLLERSSFREVYRRIVAETFRDIRRAKEPPLTSIDKLADDGYFDRDHDAEAIQALGAELPGRIRDEFDRKGVLPAAPTDVRKCLWCGKALTGARSNQDYCNDTHSKRYRRALKRGDLP